MSNLLPYKGAQPSIHPGAFIAPNAVIIGDVTIGDGSSVWFGSVLRGDICSIRVGRNTNIQDGVIIHGDPGSQVNIGSNVTIGHRALIHGCDIEDFALIGMGAILLDGAVVGAQAMVGAAALVTQGKQIGVRSLWLGNPARHARDLDTTTLQGMHENARHYVEQASTYGSMRQEDSL